MAKKNIQPEESNVEIITPDVDKKEKKNAKVDNSKQKNKSKKQYFLHLFTLFLHLKKKLHIVTSSSYYLLLNCGALLAAFNPYFFLSFTLGSLVISFITFIIN